MAQLMEVIRDRQEKSGVSIERYANLIGLTGGALYNYLNGNRKTVSTVAIRKMARHYYEHGDSEALSALVSYVTGLDNINVIPSAN